MRTRTLVLPALALLVAAAVPAPTANAHACVQFTGGWCDVTDCPDGTYHRHIGVTPLPESCRSSAYNCPDFTHFYFSGGSVNLDSQTADARTRALGSVIVWGASTMDCDGDGIPGGGGEWNNGIGGGFFPRDHHGLNVCVNDAVFGGSVVFVTGVDGDGDGLITPDTNPADQIAGPFIGCGFAPSGDACTHVPTNTDPNLEIGSLESTSSHCTLPDGVDGFWVFLQGADIVENNGGISTSNPPTSGIITTW